MKYKFLATLIASTLLAGCHMDDEVISTSKSVQAFDGAIWGIEGQYNCDGDVSGSSGTTDYDGYVKVTNRTFIDNPETCAFEFVPTAGAIDTSNGKDMSKVSYKAPKGLFKAGETATASPITTLIAKELGDKPYDESTATEVLETLGLGDIANAAGISVTEFLQDTQASLEKIEQEAPELYSKVAATTVVLSDTLVAQPDADVAAIKDVTVVMTTSVLEQHPEYPTSADSGKEIVVDLTEQLADKETFEAVQEVAEEVKKAEAKGEKVSVNDVMKDKGLDDVVEAVEKPKEAVVPPKPADPTEPPTKPVDPVDPVDPTGGTGGTGATGSNGGTGA